jgi:asparagine synthase (glutamine-hydrolysing)
LRGYARSVCGICGVVQVSGVPREVVEPEILDAMTDVMEHRGPNDRGTYFAPGIALGVRRLSIVDVEGGHQPVTSEDASIVAVQNGELYNHDDIRRALRSDGHTFASRCDTEILPHLYERDRDRFPTALRGKFGIAVWDGPRRRAVLARDRLGVKPLYWARSGDLVVFASELKSVLASGLVALDLDHEALDLYLTLGFIPGPKTPLRDVQKLAPGAILVVDNGAVDQQVYWNYPLPAPEGSARTVDDYADELLELLRAAVRDRLMSDVPLGAMLSGGLDSSLIVALMAEEMNQPVDTFTVGFREDSSNELADARLIARHFGCRHHELELSVTDDMIGLDELVWHLDEPVADLSALGFDVLSKLAAEHVTVALAGQGADELFGGYTKHRAAAAIGTAQFLPATVRRALGRVPLPAGRGSRMLNAISAPDPSRRLLAMSGRLTDEQRAQLYRGALSHTPHDGAYGAVEEIRSGLDGDPLAVTLYLDARLGLIDHMLLYFDRTSMAHSLEVRVPFLDHRLVEWAAALPTSMKIHRRMTKRVLRQAGLRLLPGAALRKRKVGFFRSALDEWLLAQLRSGMRERLLAPDASVSQLLNRSALERLVSDFEHHPGEERGRVVFAVLVLEAWLSTFRDRATPRFGPIYTGGV